MSRTPFVSPQRYQAPGGVPRGLLVGVLTVLVVLALVVAWLTADDRPAPRTGDARAREQLEKADTVRAQPRGSARAVDEAAEHARQSLRHADERSPSSQAGPPTSGGPAAPTPKVELLLPTDSGVDAHHPARLGRDDDEEPGHTAREMEARSAETRIFDASSETDTAAVRALAAQEESIDSGAGPSLRRTALADSTPGAARPGTSGNFAPAPFGGPPLDPTAGLQQVIGTLQQLSPPRAQDASRRFEDWQARAAAPSDAGALAPRPAAGPLVIDQGTVIPAVLTRRIRSDAAGVITAMVSMDVYDSRTARTLLLPKGARLVGRYDNDIASGQTRLQFVFTRLLLPDGASFDLPGAVGSDAAGQGGLEADVDRHVLQTFGAALLIGVLADRVVRPEAVPPAGLVGGGMSATGQVLVDTANAALQRNAAIPPTLTVDEGARLNVEVVRDMVFSHPYRSPS